MLPDDTTVFLIYTENSNGNKTNNQINVTQNGAQGSKPNWQRRLNKT